MKRDSVVKLVEPLVSAMLASDYARAFEAWKSVGEVLHELAPGPQSVFQHMTSEEHKAAGHWMLTRRERPGAYLLYWEDPLNRFFVPAEERPYDTWREARTRAIRFYGLPARRAAW